MVLFLGKFGNINTINQIKLLIFCVLKLLTINTSLWFDCFHVMTMMVNCFLWKGWPTKVCWPFKTQHHKMVERIVRRSHYRKPDTPWAGFEPLQYYSLGFVWWNCIVVITTTAPHKVPPIVFSVEIRSFVSPKKV